MPRLYAHRGAAAEQPENTLPSFRLALELGAHALEMDVHTTLDGHVVVSHDPDGARMCGVFAQLRRTRLEELKSWDAGWGFALSGGHPFRGRGIRVPTLEEVLVELPGVPINVDLKQREPDVVRPFIDAVRRAGAEDRVLATSFQSATIERLRALGWRGETGLGMSDAARVLAMPAALQRRARKPADAAQLPVAWGPLRLATRTVVDKCHALGMRVDFWTVNDPADARELLALGADGIMTDDPRALAPLFR